jgi:hypothetical protein
VWKLPGPEEFHESMERLVTVSQKQARTSSIGRLILSLKIYNFPIKFEIPKTTPGISGPENKKFINFAVLGKKNRNLGKFHLPKHVKCSGLLGQKLHFAFLGKALLP